MPPLPEMKGSAGSGGDSGEVLAAVQQLMQAAAKQQQAAVSALELKLSKQSEDMMKLITSLGEKLDKVTPPS